MKLGYTIVYVPDVSASLTFFEQAFGLQRKFLHESGTYGELDTGATTLSFAAHALGDMNFPGGHVHADTSPQPLGFEVAFVTEDVPSAHAQAVNAGAAELAAPQLKPWGQTVSYVRCPDGVLVELCSPILPAPTGPDPMDTDRTLRTERTLPFSPQAIYDAFASAEVLASWWGPQGFTNTFETFEFKVGGPWVFTMHGPDGKSYANKSFFAELEPAQRVVIRHDCPPHFTLTVQLSPVAGGTHLTWVQAFDDAETAQAVQAIVGPANEQNLDRLTHALTLGRG